MNASRRQRALGDATGIARTGAATIAVVFGGFGVWASTAPLGGAVVALGSVAVAANRQALQHPDGGSVREILAKPGDRVAQGQVLLRLDATAVRAEVDILARQQAEVFARETRLAAERDGSGTFEFTPALKAAVAGYDRSDLLAGQIALFEARRRVHDGEVSALRKKIAQVSEQVVGISAQETSVVEQIRLIDEELSGVRSLYKRGYSTKPRMLQLDRTRTELDGQRGKLAAQSAQLVEAASEAEIRIEQLRRDRLEKITAELEAARAELYAIEPKLAEARVRLERTDLRAPRGGEVVDLVAFTMGGVIAPGARVLDIVPSDSPLVIEARVKAADIENVAPRMAATVRFVTLRAPDVPVVGGVVTRVSADRAIDGQKTSGEYAVTVELERRASPRMRGLRVGMPVEVIVPTKSRTLLDYLIAPLSNSLARTMVED